MTAVLIDVFIADAGGMMPALLFVKYVLMTLVVSLVCDFMFVVPLMSTLLRQ